MTSDELDKPATRRDILSILDEQQVATRRDIIELREELRSELDGRVAELRRHFDVVAESFKSDFKNLFDWTKATTDTLGARVDRIEDDHGGRLTSLERRVTRIETRDRR